MAPFSPRPHRTTPLVAALAACLVVASAPLAAADRAAPVESRVGPSALELESRLARLERAVAGQGLLDLANQVASLQRDIRLMRGELENQAYLVDQLRTQVEQLQLRQDELASGAAASGSMSADAPMPVRPSLAAPPGAEPLGEPAAGADALTVTVGEGAEAADLPAATGAGGSEAALALGAPGTTAVDATVDAAEAEAAYDAAFGQIKAGDYPAAITSFEDFLATYPTSANADNAQYWLAEAFYVTEDYERAIAEYQRLLDSYPDSQKVTQALLKIGFSLEARGEVPAAREALTALVRDYPNTTAARLAAERLEALPAPASAE